MSDTMNKIGAASRFALGCVLLFAAYSKFAAPFEEFAVVIDAYRILPPAFSAFLSQTLPFVEFALGLALVGGFSSQKAPLLAGAFFLAFVFAIGSTMIRGVELPSCGCFGGGIKLTPLQAMGVDSFLICLSYCAYRWHGAYAPIDAWIAKGKV